MKKFFKFCHFTLQGKLMIKKALVFSTISLLTATAFASNLATVNGKGIPSEYADIVYQKEFATRGVADTPELRANIKQQLINREVVVQEAERQKLDTSEEGKLQLMAARRDALIYTLRKSYLAKNPVSDQELKAAYDQVVQENSKQYNIQHIVVKTADEAKAIIAQLNKGGNFDKIAKEKSTEKETGKNGGNLGWVPVGAIIPPVRSVVTTMKKGQVTGTPIQTPAGFHVVKLIDTRSVTVPTLDQIKPRLKFQLEEKKWTEYMQSLVKSAKIQ